MKRKRKSISRKKGPHKSKWITSDHETTGKVQKVQKVHQNQMDVSRNQLQNIKLFSTMLGNENENRISMETVSQNNEITYERIGSLSDKENEHVDTVNISEIVQNPIPQSQIQPNLLSSRENLTINDSQARVPNYVNVHPLFTKKHFEFVSCSENNGVIAKCSECNKNKLGSFKTIANFKLHFQRVHPKAYAQLENSNVPNEEIKKTNHKKYNQQKRSKRFERRC